MNKTKQIPFKEFKTLCRYNDEGYCTHCTYDKNGIMIVTNNYHKGITSSGYAKCNYQICPYKSDQCIKS